MRRILYHAGFVLLFLSVIVLLGHATDKGKLEKRVRGWISAVNAGNYELCQAYVAPPEFTGGGGLTITIRGGEEFLFFSGSELLPFSDYKIKKVEFHNNGYESKVTINAGVVIQPKSTNIEEKGHAQPDMMVFPASITQRWICLNGEWFIKSQFRLQYLGSS